MIDEQSSVPSAAVAALTADPAKVRAYRLDTYFREGYTLLADLGATGLLHDLTFTVLKPDAVAGRRGTALLTALEQRGWLPVGSTLIDFDPLLVRELWRYQFNIASEHRIAVVDPLLLSGPSVLVVWREASRRPCDPPASLRLTALKGASDPGQSVSGDLRTQLRRVNGLLNVVHTPDEPADVVRELRLLTYRGGTRWLADAVATASRGGRDARAEVGVRHLIDEAERAVPAHDLHAEASVERLTGRADGWGRLARTRQAGVDDWVSELRHTPLPDGPGRWDVLTVLTQLIQCNEPRLVPILATSRAQPWRSVAQTAAGNFVGAHS